MKLSAGRIAMQAAVMHINMPTCVLIFCSAVAIVTLRLHCSVRQPAADAPDSAVAHSPGLANLAAFAVAHRTSAASAVASRSADACAADHAERAHQEAARGAETALPAGASELVAPPSSLRLH